MLSNANISDFWAWGYLKDKVFAFPQPTTLPQLKARIHQEIQALTPQMIRKACVNSFAKRCRQVIAANGGHIEK